MLTEDGKHLYVSWDEYHLLTERLALKVAHSGWEFDQILAPKGNLPEIFLGLSPLEDRFAYHRASPVNYVTKASNHIAFFMAWGTRDDIVDPMSQSGQMMAALKRADYFVRSATVDAGHFWISEPLDEPGSFPGFVAPRILRFLQEKL